MCHPDVNMRVSIREALSDNWFAAKEDTVLPKHALKQSRKRMKEFGAKSLIDKATALYLVEKINEDELMVLNEAFKYMESNEGKS